MEKNSKISERAVEAIKNFSECGSEKGIVNGKRGR